jgi:hypothetical protein
MLHYDLWYFVMVSPALLLMMWAQWRVKSAYARGMQIAAPLSGAAAARYILDQAGLHHVQIEEVEGELSDHYDPREKVLRLSTDVYRSASLTAVGIAAHEAGHAIQDGRGYAPLVIRNFAVPAATYGPTLAMILFVVGMLMHGNPLLIGLGLICFSGVVVFQLINLPVEFDASNRAKQLLSEHAIVDPQGALVVRDVLNAAGWTYVAGTLQSVLTLLYYVMRFAGGSRRD